MVDLPLPSTIMSKNGWNANNKSLRPRSFCLEHAVEIVELLQSKGGANVIVICHSGKILLLFIFIKFGNLITSRSAM